MAGWPLAHPCVHAMSIRTTSDAPGASATASHRGGLPQHRYLLARPVRTGNRPEPSGSSTTHHATRSQRSHPRATGRWACTSQPDFGRGPERSSSPPEPQPARPFRNTVPTPDLPPWPAPSSKLRSYRSSSMRIRTLAFRSARMVEHFVSASYESCSRVLHCGAEGLQVPADVQSTFSPALSGELAIAATSASTERRALELLLPVGAQNLEGRRNSSKLQPTTVAISSSGCAGVVSCPPALPS